jgi:hypothetical protein
MFLLYLALFITALYAFLIRGWLWKALIFIFAIVGMYAFLVVYVPSSKMTLLTLASIHLSYAQVIPVLITLLALLTSRRKQ